MDEEIMLMISFSHFFEHFQRYVRMRKKIRKEVRNQETWRNRN